MAQTTRTDVGTVRVRIERRGAFPDGTPIYHARMVGKSYGITIDDTIGGGERQCVAEVGGMMRERGFTGSIRVVR